MYRSTTRSLHTIQCISESRHSRSLAPTSPAIRFGSSHLWCRSDFPGRPKHLTVHEIEDSIAAASAKVHASSKGSRQEKAGEEEMQQMRRKLWAQKQAQQEPHTSRSGRAVCFSTPVVEATPESPLLSCTFSLVFARWRSHRECIRLLPL